MKKTTRQNIDHTQYPHYEGVIDDFNVSSKTTPKRKVMLSKQGQQIMNAIRYGVAIQIELLDPNFWLEVMHKEYLYLCKHFKLTPYSKEAGKYIQLVWTGGKNDTNQVVSQNTLVWEVPYTKLDNRIKSQDEIDKQHIASGHIFTRKYDLTKKDGDTIKVGTNIKMPVENRTKLELVRIDNLNLHPDFRKVFLSKNQVTGKYEYVDYDPAKHHNQFDASELNPLVSAANGIVDREMMRINCLILTNRKDREVGKLIGLTGAKIIHEYGKATSKTKAQAAAKLLKENPNFPITLDGNTIKNIEAVSKKSPNRKKYYIYSELGYPLATEGLSFNELRRFFSKYAKQTIRGYIGRGEPISHQGRNYLVSKAGNNIDAFPDKTRELIEALNTQREYVKDLLSGMELTTCGAITVKVLYLTLIGRTPKQIAKSLGLSLQATKQHQRMGKQGMRNAKKFYQATMSGELQTYNHTPQAQKDFIKSNLVDAELHSFGELPKMKNYFTDIADMYETEFAAVNA